MSKQLRDRMSICDHKVSLKTLSAITAFLDRNKKQIKIKSFDVALSDLKSSGKRFFVRLIFTYPHEPEDYKYGIRDRFRDVLDLTFVEDQGENIEEEERKSNEQEKETGEGE